MRRAERTILRRIEALPLTPAERNEALQYFRLGQAVADLLLGLQRLFAHRPTPRAVPHH